jgi:hypothetical protein
MGGAAFGTRAPALPTNLELEDVPFQTWARDLFDYRQSEEGDLYDPRADNERDSEHFLDLTE